VRLAFIVLAHRYPLQLGRLVERLAAPEARIYLHVDRGTPPEVYASMRRELAGRSGVTWLGRCYSRHASFGLVQAALAGLRSALADGCDYAQLLSGQDYPLRPVAALEEFLTAHAGRSFIQFRPLPDEDWPREGAARFARWHFRFDWPETRLRVKLERGLGRVFNRLWPNRRPPANLALYGGAAWWCLHASCAKQALGFAGSRGGAFFRFARYPDEAFFQTALWNSPRRAALHGSHLTYIDWNGPPFPRLLGPEDFEALAASGKFFARKFDPARSQGLLDRIDTELL
jgi:hypothetical protein